MNNSSNQSIFYKIIFIVLSICSIKLYAQNLPLGTWVAHVPLSSATSICQSKDYVYAACNSGVLGVNIDNNLIERYTKISGLAEVLVSQLGYDTATSTLVITYQNSNIDLVQNGKITNLPYLKNAAIAGNKNIYAVYCTNGIAYIGTGFGLLKVDLVKNEISESYTFRIGSNNIRTNAVWANNNEIFCATANGVISARIAPNINLLDFNNWNQHSSGIPQSNASAITQYQGKIITAIDNTLYQFDGNNWSVFFSEAEWNTLHLNNSNGQLQIAQHKINGGNVVDKRIGKWNGSAFTYVAAQFDIERPMQVLNDKNGNFWHADEYRGLIRQQDNGNLSSVIPNAPYTINCREMEYYNGTLWATSSAIKNNWNPSGLQSAKTFSSYTNAEWRNYTPYEFSWLDSIDQIAVVKVLPNENKILFGGASYADGGILEFSPDGNSHKIVKSAPGVSASFRITSADIDAQGNAWFSNAYSGGASVVCRKYDGSYIYFNSGFLNGMLVKDILVDDYNQIWIAKEHSTGGIVVLNYGNDIDDKSDDQFFNLAAGSGYGNLPVNNVICMAKDKDGVIWLGTTEGIAIVPCAGYVAENACEAEQICVDRNDGSEFCDNLLEDEIVNCITVDAGNRKWIGTNNGVFLVSGDGTKTIYNFNETNSPLLSNFVRNITINTENGDVFFATEKGICSYRAEATYTTENTEDAFVYPNPVTKDYRGLIAVKGIPNNSNVKIVDVSGNLVYETTAIGGQATWNGLLLNGERAATGVYFALCQGSGKKQKAKLKFVLIN